MYGSILEDLLKLSKPTDTNIDPSEIEGSCVLLQSNGKNLEIEENKRKAKAKKEEPSIFNSVFAKLKLLLGTLNPTSRIRYLILNLIDKREKGWPESKSEAEGPKTLKEVHEEDEKQKAILEAENTRGHDSYGYGYESQPQHEERGQPSVVYVRKKESSNRGTGNTWNEFEQVVPKIDIEELTSKIANHLEQNFELANISYENLKDLKSSGISGKEIVPIIIQSAFKSSNVSKVIVSKPTSLLVIYMALQLAEFTNQKILLREFQHIFKFLMNWNPKITII